MPPYRLLWLQIAERQYLDLPPDVRKLVDARLARLEQDSLGLSDAVYDAASDQWSVTLADRGFLLYAVVADPATVIVLRGCSFTSRRSASTTRSRYRQWTSPSSCTDGGRGPNRRRGQHLPSCTASACRRK